MSNSSCEDFWEVMKPLFKGTPEVHLLAIFKRAITLLVTDTKVVLRLPSQERDAPVSFLSS